ncbi:MAG: site-specific DNA-methyltransferase [Mollicutes bacterium]|nr:site-specific DNA-methyltransferase [Mollicutes bacterium]
MREFTNEGDVVFDPFVGSGTTAVETLYAERNESVISTL